MARHRSPDRLPNLVRAATAVFIRAGGVRRAQVDDVARELGVAKGTVYLYVAGKEALFDLALRRADQPDDLPWPEALPLPNPGPEETLAFVGAVAAEQAAFPALAAAVGPPRPGERDEVLAELYDTLARNRTRLKLVATSAVDWPELGALWFGRTRGRLVSRLAAWIADRSDRSALAPGLHPLATARLLAETATWFAVHRHWDPLPDGLDDALVRATTLSALARVLGDPR